MIYKHLMFFSACVLLSACSLMATQDAPKVRPQGKSPSVKTTAKTTTPPKAVTSSSLSKSEAKARLAAGATLIDARSAEEFAANHSPSAINVPYELLEPTLPALDSYKEKEILVVGKNQEQVEAMRKSMLKAGFKKVLNAFSLNS